MTENLEVPALELPNQTTTLRGMLRLATHQQHLRLNQNPLLASLIHPGCSLISYRNLLLTYFHLYSALESGINCFLQKEACIFEYTKRNKLPWLIKDIKYFQDDLPELEQIRLPSAMSLEIRSLADIIGVLYVIEGATLGGQLISHSLLEHHGLTPGKGACFFNGYGEQTMHMWQDFLQFAETIAGSPDMCRSAENAACQTFQLFEQAIAEYSHKYLATEI